MTGEAGYHNLGDEGMALASCLRLRKQFPEATIVATGLDPLGSVLRHQAKIVPWPLLPYQLDNSYGQRLVQRIGRKFGASEDFMDPVGRDFDSIFADQIRHNKIFRDVVKEMESADFVFDMGHGALNDVFNPFMLCLIYYLAGKLEKPLFISGQTIGPIWRQQSRRMLNDTLRNAHTLGLRDEQISRSELLQNIGFQSSDTHIVELGDDTLDLSPKEPDLAKLAPKVRQLIEDQAFFSVQWRTSDYTHGLSDTKQLESLIEAIRIAYTDSGLTPLFVPLSWESRHSDIVIAARIIDYLQDELPFEVMWNFLRAEEIKWLLGKARFGIGLSYHFHVFSLTQGVPTIAFYTNQYYELKLKGCFAAYDYDSEPFSYPLDVSLHESKYKDAISTINLWTENDANRLRNKAALLSTKWHNAFEEFSKDSGLRRLNRERDSIVIG